MNYLNNINIKLGLLLCFLTTTAFSQKAELSPFEKLVSKTWKAEGKWGDGSKFFFKKSILNLP